MCAGVGEAQIQRFGDPGDNAVLIKTPIAEGSEEALAKEDFVVLPYTIDDPVLCRKLAERVRRELSNIDGATDLRDDYRVGRPELRLRILPLAVD